MSSRVDRGSDPQSFERVVQALAPSAAVAWRHAIGIPCHETCPSATFHPAHGRRSVVDQIARADLGFDAMAAGGDEAKRAFEAMMSMQKIDVATIEAARRG